ncbi:MAG: flavin reductase family protein [Defluviitaleaceae bacterium]|nr:flavin reductase family protein [Defluviitaleaceae bacterium]
MKFHDKLGQIMESFANHKGGFLTVKDADGRVNTMTISWGFGGVMWGKPHFITVVRPVRFTWDLLKTADSFTVSVPFEGMDEELRICGVESGRDIDKSKVVTFQDAKSVASPVVAGCDAYYECKINYVDDLKGDKLAAINEKFYPEKDWHDMIFGEIVEAY